MPLSVDQLREALLFLIALVLSISVHEFGHAWMADKLGDPLPRSQGRLTLSPVAHVDPIGTILMPLIIFFTNAPLLGWGRPVQTNPVAYTRRFRMRTGHMLVAAAGPAMNLILAVLISAVVVILARVGQLSEEAALTVVKKAVLLNLSLMLFNLLPVPPLDGGTVLAGLLPDSLQGISSFLQRYGYAILLGLMLTRLLGRVMAPAYHLAGMWAVMVLRLAYPVAEMAGA
jgi:Zn-dependent protease